MTDSISKDMPVTWGDLERLMYAARFGKSLHVVVQEAIAALPAQEEAPRCVDCGYPRKEHDMNGACYGLCPKYRAAPVPPAGDDVRRLWLCDLLRNPANGGMNSVMREAADLIERLARENRKLKDAAAEAMLSSAAISHIRSMLRHFEVPEAAFIDDHVGNAIVQRNEATERAESAEAKLETARTALEEISNAPIAPTSGHLSLKAREALSK